jgi:hypothetical protein
MVLSEIIEILGPNLGSGKLRIFQLFHLASPNQKLIRTLYKDHAGSTFLVLFFSTYS